MRYIDVAHKRSRDLTNGPKAYATAAITDRGGAFAAATSSMIGSRLIYAVEVLQIDSLRPRLVGEAPDLEGVRCAAAVRHHAAGMPLAFRILAICPAWSFQW